MSRRADFHFTLPNGKLVGYGLFKHRGIYHVRFQAPDGEGYKKASTGSRTINDAHIQAAKIVLKAYGPQAPDPRQVTWDTAVAELGATAGMRPDTLFDYQKAIRVFRATVSGTNGPAGVTQEHANRFKRLFGSTPYKRGKKSDAKEYKRSSTTLAGYLRKLSSLWGKHFKELGYVSENPWANISRPPVEKTRKHVPTGDQFAHFLQWLDNKYPTWALVRIWVLVKAVSGCRTQDLCLLKSDSLRDGRLVFPAAVKKERAERAVRLPPDLYEELRSLAGSTWLWERYTQDAKRFRPGSKNKDEFEPKTLYWAMSNIFREYNEAHPDRPRLTPHSLKRRAITIATQQMKSVDAAADAIGTTSQTAKKYYLDARQAFDADRVFEQLAQAILPDGESKPAGSEPKPPS